MKEFTGHIFYKGYKLKARFCAENLRAASNILGKSKYQIKTHFTYHTTIKTYSDIRVCADNKRALKVLKDPNWMSYTEAKTLIENNI